MKSTAPKKQKNRYLMVIAVLSLTAAISTSQAASGESENTKEFLSDPHRVGTITGSILGGVLTAHPAGSIAGSILGYIVGKQSIFKSPKQQRLAQASFAKRSIIPSTALARQAPSSPEQIASYCYGNLGNTIDPKLRAMCYYYSRI